MSRAVTYWTTGVLLLSDSVLANCQEMVSEPDGDDFAADTTSRGRALVGESVTGNSDRTDDEDVFRVGLEAGTRCRIDVEGSATVRGTLEEPRIAAILGPDEKHSATKMWMTRCMTRMKGGRTP